MITISQLLENNPITMEIAVFPGSFDPFTKGHEDIVLRAMPLFDKIYILIGVNITKQSFFPLDKRVKWIQQLYAENTAIEVVTWEGLTVDFCKSINAKFLLRGIRNSIDFQMEKDVAQANKLLYPQLETLFLANAPQFAHLSSTIVRDIFVHNGDYSIYVSYPLSR